MRSQSNISLYSKKSDAASNTIVGEVTKLSSIIKFKSPDMTLKGGKFKQIKSDKFIKEKSFNIYDLGKENVPQNASIISTNNQNYEDMSYFTNNNHLAETYMHHKKMNNIDLKSTVDL